MIYFLINKIFLGIKFMGACLESYAVADADDGVINGNGDGRTREDMQRLGPIYLRKREEFSHASGGYSKDDCTASDHQL